MCVGERALKSTSGLKAALKPSPRSGPLSPKAPPCLPSSHRPILVRCPRLYGTKEHFSSPGAPPTSATCLHRAAAPPRGAQRIQKSGTQTRTRGPPAPLALPVSGDKVRGQNGVSFIKDKSLGFRTFFILRNVTRDSHFRPPFKIKGQAGNATSAFKVGRVGVYLEGADSKKQPVYEEVRVTKATCDTCRRSCPEVLTTVGSSANGACFKLTGDLYCGGAALAWASSRALWS